MNSMVVRRVLGSLTHVSTKDERQRGGSEEAPRVIPQAPPPLEGTGRASARVLLSEKNKTTHCPCYVDFSFVMTLLLRS